MLTGGALDTALSFVLDMPNGGRSPSAGDVWAWAATFYYAKGPFVRSNNCSFIFLFDFNFMFLASQRDKDKLRLDRLRCIEDNRRLIAEKIARKEVSALRRLRFVQ